MAAHRNRQRDLEPGPAQDLVDLFQELLEVKPRTVGQIAAATSVARGHVSEVLRGIKAPSAAVAGAIARYLGGDANGARAEELADRLKRLNQFRRSRRTVQASAATGAHLEPVAARRPARTARRGVVGETQYIVGRQQEVDEFDAMLDGRAGYDVLNIYGPGGIGKTVVARRMFNHARDRAIPVANVGISRPEVSVDGILNAAIQTLIETIDERLREPLNAFLAKLDDFQSVTGLLASTGGVEHLYDALGQPSNPAALAAATAGREWPDRLQAVIRNRIALDRYLRQAEQALSDGFAAALEAMVDDGQTHIALIVDTYEDIGALDNWVCRRLVPALPIGVRTVIIGRNQLTRMNFDWADHGDDLHMRPLPELAKDEARLYLRHYGVTDDVLFEKVFRFTGGYPLLLVLVRLLAQEGGGWAAIGELEHSSDRDLVATRLLERILREESAREVRDVLERTAIAPWINPEIIAALLDLDPGDARQAYEKVQRHSFMEPHPHGVKLHDKIKELLSGRLKFTSAEEYDRLEAKLGAYFAAKAGVTDHDS